MGVDVLLRVLIRPHEGIQAKFNFRTKSTIVRHAACGMRLACLHDTTLVRHEMKENGSGRLEVKENVFS